MSKTEMPQEYRGTNFVSVYRYGANQYGFAMRPSMDQLLEDMNGREGIGDKILKVFSNVNTEFIGKLNAYVKRISGGEAVVTSVELSDVLENGN
ncbi:hypothetical protein KY311_04575 [Candidatus Woesearchaeota archaeon]|nr:hypothetical protein [Candidatus Woesearchaeota archaeon]